MTVPDGSDSRLDQLLVELLSGSRALTRSRIQRLIGMGMVRIGGEPVSKPGMRPNPGSEIAITIPPEEPLTIEPYDFPLDVLYEDRTLLVVNKPFGLTMHPGAGTKSDTLVHALAAHYRDTRFSDEFEGSERPGIVHRLDKDTTGIVVIARDAAAHAALSAQFAERSTERRYSALLLSGPRGPKGIGGDDAGVVNLPLGRHPTDRTRMAVLSEGGRRAVTHWRIVERMEYAVLAELSLETGRTHQIRVHMSHTGAPVIGDQVYGRFEALPPRLRGAADRFGRQALHAASLAFTHPVTGERLRFTSEPPADMLELIATFRGNAHSENES